jgi:hypothetical protein
MSGRTFEISDRKGFKGGKLQINTLKQFIMVSGLDYHDLWSFNKYAEKNKSKILKSKKDTEDFVFYMIDILVGKITKIEILGANKPKETITKFDIVDKSNYASHYFESKGKKIISKLDVYKLIEEIGTNKPNTLFEVCVYSHAYWNGPILVDSGTGIDDHDMRIADAAGINSLNFNKAFDSKGIMKIWGCSFPRDTNALFSKIRKNANYTVNDSIKDDVKFKFPKNHFVFKLDSQPEVDLTKQINGILKTSFLVTDAIELTFLQIKKIACFNYINTYAAKFAGTFNINIQAALPATYAEINPDFHISSLTLENVKFYNKHLNVKLGDLNYGLYDKKTVDDLTKIFNS